MIKFLDKALIAGQWFGRGMLAEFDAKTEAHLIAEGDAVAYTVEVAGTIEHALTADHATTATSATTATTANNALTANSASTASTAANATNATSADYAQTAGTAASATSATNADHATTADTASTASHATTATSAGSAETATSAISATTATSATTAGHATTADSATSALSATGVAIHPYYHFHGYAGNHTSDDDKFLDLSGINHGYRGANLSTSQLWATAGYASTVDPVGGATDSVLRIPNLNWDYASGEKLIIWWLGKVTPEVSSARMMGDGFGTVAGEGGIRIAISTGGMVSMALSGSGTEIYSSTASTSISARLASFAFAVDGQGKQHGIWVDEAYQLSDGSYTALTGWIDTKNSNTFNIGTSFPASSSSTSGIATATRALVIMRLPSTYAMPVVGTLTEVFKQLRANPSRVITEGAF